jgi:hypothetical protein
MIVLGIFLPGFVREVHELFWSMPALGESGYANNLRHAANLVHRRKPDNIVIQLLQDIYFSARLDVDFDVETFKEEDLDEGITYMAGVLDGFIYTVVRQILREGWLDPHDDQGKTAREEDRRIALARAS